jgi:site-specific DNA-adenine methylase
MSIGIPYMGSKRKLAPKIIDFIIKENPEARYFFDLFGGGGAVSFEALKRHQFERVVYNELNTGVVELLKKIRTDGVTEEFYQWVDRETFHKHKEDKNWFGGLIKTCWSFGNDQKNYLFSQDNEEMKKPLHEIVVNSCGKSADLFKEKYGLEIPKELYTKRVDLFGKEESINERRLRVMRFVKKQKYVFQQLQRLQRLQRLQQLQQLERLEIFNLSYEQVKIDTPIDETVIYLDPPYKNTGKYQIKVDYDQLLEFILSSPYKIYVSGYDMPELTTVLEMHHRSTFSQRLNQKVTEKLFCNK